jgi:hypothetical protein
MIEEGISVLSLERSHYNNSLAAYQTACLP